MTEPSLCGKRGWWGRSGAGRCGRFLFVQELDFAHPHAAVVEEEFLGVVDGVAEFYFLADVGGGHFVEGALETDGGVVVDEAFVADEEDLVEFGLGQAAQFYPCKGGIVAVDGFIIDAAVELVVVVFLEPQPESLVEVLERDAILEAGKEAIPDRAKQPFDFSAGGAVVGFGVDEGDAGQGAAFGEQV
jgi:hypothetical protein